MLKIWPALLVHRDDGAILSIVSSEIVLSLRPDAGDLAPNVGDHLTEIQAAHLSLAKEIEKHVRGLSAPKPLSEFPGFPPKRTPSSEDFAYGKKAYATWTNGANSGAAIHVVALGDAEHFLLGETAFRGCQFHSDDASRAVSRFFSGTGVTRDDSTMFVSGDAYYCGHRDVRAKRAPICIVRDIELQLCCRNCVFLSVCWGGRQAEMPCQMLPVASEPLGDIPYVGPAKTGQAPTQK